MVLRIIQPHILPPYSTSARMLSNLLIFAQLLFLHSIFSTGTFLGQSFLFLRGLFPDKHRLSPLGAKRAAAGHNKLPLVRTPHSFKFFTTTTTETKAVAQLFRSVGSSHSLYTVGTRTLNRLSFCSRAVVTISVTGGI